MTEATSGNAVADAAQTVTGLAYFQAYFMLFAAHWFGARRFDRVGNPESFDPEDVQAYRAQKSEYLKKNFTRSQSVLVAAQATAAREESAVETERPGQQLETQVAEGAAGALGDAAADETHPTGQAEADQNETGQTAVGQIEGDESGRHGQASSGSTEVRVATSKQVLPWFVILQSILMCGFWGVFALKKAQDDGMTGTDPWLAGLDSISRGSTDLRWSGPNCEDHRAEVWRWLTYQWTHIGVGHVLTNTIVLLVFGWALEGHEGSIRMSIIFNAGVIAGALCWFVGGAHGSVVGTSGGTYALIGLQFEDLIMNWRERHFRRWILAILLAFAFVDALTWGLSMDLSKADYSYSVAFGGGLAGLIMGSMIGRNYFVTKKDRLFMLGMACLGFVLLIFAILWLALNEAPLNIWEAASAENGYCWVGQFYNARVNMTNYQCVRCATEECVQEWRLQENMLSVNPSACDTQGWHFDER